ncbi:hypothetical protein IGI96_002325 [Enterococcus sp. DIV0421]|uniref:hypothetical protein n=1 Tax=Enterococcus TaxID=1350 RepID=UPI000A35A53B|nr:hypothetical protein [Enterococcus sp. 5B3_DIV0040]OTO01178.1 hypothetical protein A5883_003495 [Enterococcus sp. 5B3_DIV0040]
MTNYTEKEKYVIKKIQKTIIKLDNNFDKIDYLSKGQQKHTLKKSFAEKEALHEIRHILNEADHYKTYEVNELVQSISYIN